MIRVIAVVVLLFHGLVAAYCGYAMMHDPSGKAMGLDIKLLYPTMFVNYFIPGLILFSFLGIGSIMGGVAALLRAKHYIRYIIFAGIIIIGWIVVQMILMRIIFFMQFVISSIGIVILLCGLSLQHKENRHKHIS